MADLQVMYPLMPLQALHRDLEGDLVRIARRFKRPKITLIVRNPELPDGDVVLSDDDLEAAIGAIRRLQDKAAYVAGPKAPGGDRG